jgi:hypothetical protein
MASAITANWLINCGEGARTPHKRLTSTSVTTQCSPKQGYWLAFALEELLEKDDGKLIFVTLIQQIPGSPLNVQKKPKLIQDYNSMAE